MLRGRRSISASSTARQERRRDPRRARGAARRCRCPRARGHPSRRRAAGSCSAAKRSAARLSRSSQRRAFAVSRTSIASACSTSSVSATASCGSGRTGAARRRAPPCARMRSIVSANVRPRGISSCRKSPMTSPSVVGLDLGADDDVQGQPALDRARAGLDAARDRVVIGHRERAEAARRAPSRAARRSASCNPTSGCCACAGRPARCRLPHYPWRSSGSRSRPGPAQPGTGAPGRAFTRMNSSTCSRANSSGCWTGGDFMRYADGNSSAPERPLSSASLAKRTASITMPAELGESQTSSLSSTLSGTSPNAAALEADVGPLAVLQPRDVVGRPDVHVVGVHLVVERRGDGVRLGDLLGLQALALEHVEEVGVAAHVELVGALEQHAALPEEARELAVDDRRADLRLDVVADDRQAGLLEAVAPVLLARDEDRHAVDVRDAGRERLLDVPLGGLLGAHRQVADEDVGLRLLEDRRRCRRSGRRPS